MRMWGVDPELLCDKHIGGEHVEMHMFAGTMRKGCRIDGYVRKGLVEPKKIVARHDALAAEMTRRGMKHNSPMSESDVEMINTYLEKRPYPEAFVDVDANLAELMRRCPRCREKIIASQSMTEADTIQKRLNMLCHIHNITAVEHIADNIGIGFSATEQVWYGWHWERVKAFGVGSIMASDIPGYQPSRRADFIAKILDKYKSRSDIHNLHFEFHDLGIDIQYDLNTDASDRPISAEARNELKAFTEETGIQPEDIINAKHQMWFAQYPKTWGRGEWIAETLDDAKQMALDYAKDPEIEL